MQTITLTFDPRSRVLTADSDGAGTVIDDSAVTFQIEPIEGATIDLQYGVTVCDGARRYHPIGRFGPDGTLALRQQVLAWCTGGTLPISLRITYDDGTVVGSRQLILGVATIPDAYTDMGSGYGELLMLRGTSWDWLPDVLYSKDSFAVHDGRIWQSLKDDNRGSEPSVDSDAWMTVGVDGVSPTAEFEGDVLVVTDADGPHESPPLTGPQGEKGDKGDKGDTGDQGYSITAQWSGDRLIITDKDGPKTSPSLTGPQGEKGDTGAKGDKGDTGEPGVSPTFEWQGTTLVITDVEGQKSQDLKGEKGDQGIQGPQGIQGETGEQGPQGIQGIQGPKGDRGEPFGVDKVYESVDAMNAGYATDGVPVGGFVVITTGDVEDEDNAKLYVKGETQYEFITDMSGAQGIQGPQGEQGPQGPVGPQGPKGDTGDAGQMDAALDAESTNGVQNRVVKAALDGKQPTGNYALKSEIPDVSGFETSSHASSTYATKTEVTSGLEGKVDKVARSRLMTDAEGSKLSGIAAGAQVNVLESVKVNNVAQHISDKAVNITVPTKVSDLSNDSGFQTASQVASAVQNGVAGKQDDFTVVSVNLPASGWSSNQQTVAVSGVTASTEIVVVSYSPGSYQAYTEAGVRATAQGAGSLTFACDEAPSADLVAEVMYA